jgi:sugar phosphate isomerase/epimerase
MLLGYSTNSIGDCDPCDAIPLLHELGYTSLAITLDHHTLDPFAADIEARIDRWRTQLAAVGMACVIETGGRHLLDPRIKHEPTLVSAAATGRDRRTEFLRRAVDIAHDLGAECVSFWSGVGRDAAPEDVLWERLLPSITPVIDQASRRGVRLGFEPEPGMFIDTLDRTAMLLERLGTPNALGVTIDLGHLECMGERPVADLLARWAPRIVNVHVDDMLACRHEHLPPGAGDVDFAAAFAALAAGGYRGGLHLELPRQSHRWIETARAAAVHLTRCMPDTRTT